MVEKLRNGYFKLKAYWRKPPKGYQVSYKEFVNISLGYGGISFLSVIVQWTSLAVSTHMMISYFKVSTGLLWVLGIVGSVIALLRSPLQSMLIDNSNSKNGKFKPFLLWTAIGTGVSLTLIPFIPIAWNDISLFSFTLPAIPIMGILDTSNISMSLAVLLMFVLLQIGNFFNAMLAQAMAGIEQTISTVAQERANIGAFRGLICNIPSSLVNLLLPVLAGSAFAASGSWNSIAMYRWVFPFCAVGGVICVLFAKKGTTERVVVNKKYVAKVKFWEGAKELSKNKYFWMISIYNVFMGLRNLQNLTTWVTQYSFDSEIAKTIVGIYCTTLLMSILVLGMLIGPLLIKKFGKRKVIITANIGATAMVLLQLLFARSAIVILIVSLFFNLFNGFAYVVNIMVSDVLDYQQWKTGKRLEGFWQNYGTFITTFLGVFTGMLLPLFLSMGGVGFSADISLALKDETLRGNIYFYQTLLALIGGVLCTLPMLFYDLTEAKHANYIRALKIRAAVDDFLSGELQDSDVLNLMEVKTYAEEKNDAFVLDELKKHDCIDAILASFDEVKARTVAKQYEEDKAQFLRDVDVEGKRLAARSEKARKLALAKNRPFDAADFENKEKLKMQYLRYFTSGDLASYGTAEDISASIDTIYPVLEEIFAREKAEAEERKKAKEQAKRDAKNARKNK